jgi:hypothetical protein
MAVREISAEMRRDRLRPIASPSGPKKRRSGTRAVEYAA